MKSVCDFGGGVAQDVADAFENGSTAQLLTSERGRTFTEDVETAVQGFYDGQISPGDLVNIGQLLNNGATWETAGALAVAAFTDLENAANKVFGTLADAFSDFFDCGVCCKDPR